MEKEVATCMAPGCSREAKFIVVDPLDHDPISREWLCCAEDLAESCTRLDGLFEPYSVTPLTAPKAVFRARLAERRAKVGARVARVTPKPRYDEVFAEGLAALERLAWADEVTDD